MDGAAPAPTMIVPPVSTHTQLPSPAQPPAAPAPPAPVPALPAFEQPTVVPGAPAAPPAPPTANQPEATQPVPKPVPTSVPTPWPSPVGQDNPPVVIDVPGGQQKPAEASSRFRVKLGK